MQTHRVATAATVALLSGCLGAQEVECGDACPPGTALAASSTVRVDAVQVVSSECAATCNPIEPCLPPNVPAAWRSEGELFFECQALGGYGTLPDIDEIDTSFGETWAPIPELLEFSPLGIAVDPLTLRHVDRDRDGVAELFAVDDGTAEGVWLVPTDDGGIAAEPAGERGTLFADLDGDQVAEALTITDVSGDPRGDVFVRRCVADGAFFFDASACVSDFLAADAGFGGIAGGVAADMDGDGDEDVLVVSSGGAVLVAAGGEGSGDSGLGPLLLIGSIGATDAVPWSPAQAGDLDGDGAADVLLSSSGGGAWLVAGGSGGWQAAQALSGDTVAAAIADADGDGTGDILAIRADSGACSEGCIAVDEVDVAEATYGTPGLTRCRGVDWSDDGAEGMICADGATALVWRAGALWDLPREVDVYNGYFSALLELSDGPALLWFLTSRDGTTTIYGVRP